MDAEGVGAEGVDVGAAEDVRGVACGGAAAFDGVAKFDEAAAFDEVAACGAADDCTGADETPFGWCMVTVRVRQTK